jgi:putative ABC transport system permease protein
VRLFRLATRLVPAAWREAISRDLEDEARTARHGRVWLTWQAIRVAVRLRWTIGGSAMMFDLRYAIRSLTHARWFAAGAILTFALGIGVNVAVFALLDRLLFRPLPYRQPSTLVVMIPSSGGQYFTRTPRPIVVDARATPAIFSGVAMAARTSAVTIDPSGDGPQLRLTEATWHLLGVLDVQPVLGRGFSEADAIAKSRVALITYEAWQRSFGGATSILGLRIGSPATSVEIVGVLPRGFTSPSPFLGPSDGLRLDPDRLTPGDLRDGVWPAVARLRPGVAVATAQAAVDAITARVSADLDPSGKRSWHIQVTSVRDALFHEWKTYLWLVAGAAALVLLIACVNLSSLLLARGRSREQTLALCTALGATPGRLVSAIFMEALVVACAGAVIALGALVMTEHAIVGLEPAALGVYAVDASDVRVLAITLGAVLASAGAAAAWPGMSASRVDVQSVLQQGTKTGRRTRSVALRTLLAAEAAFGAILVVGALLAGRSLAGLLERDLGFVPHNVFVISAGLPFQEAVPAKMAFYARARQILSHALTRWAASTPSRSAAFSPCEYSRFRPAFKKAPSIRSRATTSSRSARPSSQAARSRTLTSHTARSWPS